MILEDIRRTRIMFGSEQLVFTKAISYRPSRRKLETARSSTSYSSNDPYVYSDPDYYEFGTLKQDVQELDKRKNFHQQMVHSFVHLH